MSNADLSIEDVVSSTSVSVAKRLVEIFPGTRKYIPYTIKHDHELTALGDEVADQLSRHFGGSRIDIPMGLMNAHQRKLLIWELNDQGVGRSETALRAGCTEQRVYQILREDRPSEVPEPPTPPPTRNCPYSSKEPKAFTLIFRSL